MREVEADGIAHLITATMTGLPSHVTADHITG
jgi:hypothetical protein